MTTRLLSTATAVMAFAFLVMIFGMPSFVAAQACESTCTDSCGDLIGAEKRSCMLACFAGRCESPGAIAVGEQLGEMGQPGLSCVADGVCNAFCEEGSTPDPDCDFFPEGHVGFAVEIFLDGEKQFFATDEIISGGDATATQDASGVVALSAVPCPQVFGTQCGNKGLVQKARFGFFAAGTPVNFNLVQVSGLPADGVAAACTIDGKFLLAVSTTSLGENSFKLVADEPDRIVFRCIVQTFAPF